MRMARALSLGLDAAKDEKGIRKALKKSEHYRNLYVICMPEQEGNLLDIYEAWQLRQPYYKKSKQLILGAAIGKDEALVVATELIKEVYGNTQGFDVRTYFATKD